MEDAGHVCCFDAFSWDFVTFYDVEVSKGVVAGYFIAVGCLALQGSADICKRKKVSAHVVDEDVPLVGAVLDDL